MTSGTIVALLPDGGWKYLSAGHVHDATSTRWRTSSRAASTGGERARPRPGVRGVPARDPRRHRRPCPRRVSRTRPVACSSVTARGGRRRALRFEPTATRPPRRTATRSTRPTCYRLTIATDDADEVFWGIVHSHTHTPAVPSPTDIGLAFYPDALYLLVSLSDDEADPPPASRASGAWRIVDGAVPEVVLREPARGVARRPWRSGRAARGRRGDGPRLATAAWLDDDRATRRPIVRAALVGGSVAVGVRPAVPSASRR